MTVMVLIWLALLVVLNSTVGKPGSAGPLTMAYFLGLSLLHVPGALIYLDPNSLAPDRRETELGFQLTLIGMAALVGGAIVAGWSSRALANDSESAVASDAARVFTPNAWKMVAVVLFSPWAEPDRQTTVVSVASVTATDLGIGTLIGKESYPNNVSEFEP